jgi:hypothetical protein
LLTVFGFRLTRIKAGKRINMGGTIITINPLTPRLINQLPRAASRLSKLMAGGGLNVQVLPTGTYVNLARPRPMYAILSGSTSPYSWQQAYMDTTGPTPTPTVLPGGASGTNNAYESTGASGLAGWPVWLDYQGQNTFTFQAIRLGPRSCDPATTAISIAVVVPFFYTVDYSEITATVKLGDSTVGTCTIGPSGTCSVPISQVGTYTVTLSRAGQSDVSATTTIDDSCAQVGGAVNFYVGIVVPTGCNGAALLAGQGVSVTGPGSFSASLTTDSSGQAWFVTATTGTYTSTIVETSGRFQGATVSTFVGTAGAYQQTQLTPADGYVCAPTGCGPIGGGPISVCNYPYPTTLHATVLGQAVTVTYNPTTVGYGVWRGCKPITPLMEYTGPDSCHLGTVCNPACCDPPAPNCQPAAPPPGCSTTSQFIPTSDDALLIVQVYGSCDNQGNVSFNVDASIIVSCPGTCDSPQDPSGTFFGTDGCRVSATGGNDGFPVDVSCSIDPAFDNIGPCYNPGDPFTVTE